ncbi:MAG TPA: ThuA domain-containing protein [Verrucomicrobiae bacterium]
MKCLRNLWLALVMGMAVTAANAAEWVTYEGGKGPGKGKHIVFLSGDEEYRSEEGLPMLAQILSVHHGFKCTVLFSLNAAGDIDPDAQKNVPGMENLKSADLVVMLFRFRELPDDKMKYFVDYYLSGKPIIALRTSTHAFNYGKDSTSIYKHYGWNNSTWKGGFGKQVLGETWVAHHGAHKKEATRGIIVDSAKDHPILKGVADIFGDSDVYTATPPEDAKVLVLGQVLAGMNPTDAPVEGKQKPTDKFEKNNPLQPVVWTREYKNEAGKTNKILTTTMGAATDLQNEGLRRLLVNGVFWSLGMEKQIPAKADVTYVSEFKPTMYGFKGGKKGTKPSDYELKK